MTDIENSRRVVLDLLSEVEERNESWNILGKHIDSPYHLALAGEICRSPRFETFHYVFIRNNEVIGTTAVSSRSVGSAKTFIGDNKDAFIQRLLKQAHVLNADSYYFLHNHPSGDPTPSSIDLLATLNLTKGISKNSLMKFKGHVIINSTQYSVINQQAFFETHPIDYSTTYDLNEMRKTHSLFSETINAPVCLSAAAKLLQRSDNSFQMIGLNTKHLVNCLYEMSYDVFDNRQTKLLAKARQWAAASGVRYFALNNFDLEKLPKINRKEILEGMEKSGLIIDIITPETESLELSRKFKSGFTFPRKSASEHSQFYDTVVNDKSELPDFSSKEEENGSFYCR